MLKTSFLVCLVLISLHGEARGRNPQTGRCVRTCQGMRDDDYQSCHSCRVYATCTNGRLIDNRPCPANLVWNDKKKYCDYTSPTCGGKPTGCLVGGKRYAVGQPIKSWHPCIHCICKADGKKKCKWWKPYCPKLHCQYPVPIQGKCCKTCPPKGQPIKSWNPCLHCKCAAHGTKKCTWMAPHCPKLHCSHPVSTPGECCKKCPPQVCRFGKRYYSFGQAIHIGPCKVRCTCSKSGKFECEVPRCRAPKCKNFVVPKGQCCPVCPDKVCTQKPKPGPCKGPWKRYYFDSVNNKCRKFEKGWCKRNGNSFVTHKACLSTCLPKTKKDCMLKKNRGPCKGSLRRFYYDSKTGKCKPFIYGGCVGNSNNFGTRGACQDLCIDCGSLSNPANGYVDTSSGTTFQQNATYTCFSGYELVGVAVRTCEASGYWGSTAPTCKIKDCGSLSNPANGYVDTSSGSTFQQNATYTCFSGYDLVGVAVRTCEASGYWSSTAPTCKIKDCGPLSKPANGYVGTSSGTTFQQNATYTCFSGYELVGVAVRTCEASGYWSSTAPTCKIKDCGPLSKPANGYVGTSSGTTFQQNATYTCFSGYELVGVAVRTCEASGYWSSTAPTCKIKDCGSLSNPAYGNVDTSSGTTFQQNATYTCFSGYELVGVAVRTCEASGYWSSTAPICKIKGGRWTEWGHWTKCSVTCGTGFRIRKRKCRTINVGGALVGCTGRSFDTDSCNSFNCYPLAKTCAEWAARGMSESDMSVEIDPDGSGAVTVPCDFNTEPGKALTVLHHNQEARTLVNGAEACGSYSAKLKYKVGNERAKNIADSSSACKQYVKYECYGSAINFPGQPGCASWKNRNEEKSTYFITPGPSGSPLLYCTCGKNGTCHTPSLKCNCDSNDNAWRFDEGFVMDKASLPITEFNAGDTGDRIERGFHTIGPMYCY